jgi:hypothetical protein
MTHVDDLTVLVPHVVKGVLLEGCDVEHVAAARPFMTPRLNLDELVWPRSAPLPAAEVPVSEVIDLLVATGERLRKDPDGALAAALEGLARTSPYERTILEHSYEDLPEAFRGDRLRAQLDEELGGVDRIDGWRTVPTPPGRSGLVRAYPTRLVHILAGNAPGVACRTIVNGSLVKGVNLLKMPSNDLLTATAVLRAMAAVAPGHPTVRSFSAVYWRGGDPAVEGPLLRSQFFDKLVVWGGEGAVRNAAKYVGPGFELISFDPKSSISFLGREIFESEESICTAAALGAMDSVFYNQETCTTSRFHFVEGDEEQVDRYCELLQGELGVERRYTSAKVQPLPLDVRDEIEVLRSLEPEYRLFGDAGGAGLVIRSREPVDFNPSGKTVNVVAVSDLAEAVVHVNVATQTVGVYPADRKRGLRDALASAGAQRIITLGEVNAGAIPGFPHDGFYPLHRYVRWVTDEG